LIYQRISQHLSQPQPIHLEHKIKLSGNSPAGTACYDVQVDVPLPLQKDMTAFLTSMERNKEIDAFDEVICCTSVKKIHEHLKRRAFLLGFSQCFSGQGFKAYCRRCQPKCRKGTTF
jgi:SWI/SNF-related matrix-associated actin-dependent regulator of chromatin subfamily D